MDIFWVYSIENKINGKMYIGKTNNLKLRFKVHINKSRNTSSKSQYIHKALNQYGATNFWFKALWYCFSEQEAFEISQISLRHTNDSKFGYNLTNGGEGAKGFKHSKETKIKLSELAKLKTGNINPFYGKSHSDDVKLRSRGESNKQSKLLESQVIDILNHYYTGKYTENDLGNLFNVSRGTVNDILRDVKWKHVYKNFMKIAEVKKINKMNRGNK